MYADILLRVCEILLVYVFCIFFFLALFRAVAPKAPPATQNASQKSLKGTKNKEVKGGQNLPFLF